MTSGLNQDGPPTLDNFRNLAYGDSQVFKARFDGSLYYCKK